LTFDRAGVAFTRLEYGPPPMLSLIEAFFRNGDAGPWTWIWIASGVIAVIVFLKTLDAGEIEPPEPSEPMLLDRDEGNGHE
jgi:hypothetical protein